MGRCSYSWEEPSREKGYVEKRCLRDTWEGSNEYCIFHDPSPEKDVDLFRKMIEEQIEAETEKYNFIGYCFPDKWDFFAGKKFEISVNFMNATFQDVDFGGATFKNSNFRRATFQDADFSEVTFQDADFSEVTFYGVDFRGTTFQGTADFRETAFQGTADFGMTAFRDTTNFGGVTFRGDACFNGAIFQNVTFERASFHKKADLKLKKVEKLDFRYTEFLYRSYITTDLRKTLFHRCFIENVVFVDCRWPEDYIIYEEKHMDDEAVGLSFGQLETIYRDLTQNMRNHGDYSIAGKFYYREMEMKGKQYKLSTLQWWAHSFYRFFGYGVGVSKLVLIMLAGIIIGAYAPVPFHSKNIFTDVTVLDIVTLSLAVAALLYFLLLLSSFLRHRGGV